MNFIKEINAFEDWLETNPIPDTAQLMWYKLMSINNKCGWAKWFDLANPTLMAKMNISSDKTLNSARNILVDRGRILYKSSGNRNKAGKYSIITFFADEETTVKNTVEKGIERDVEAEVEQGVETAALNKLKETKLNNNSSSVIFGYNSVEFILALELRKQILANNQKARVPDDKGLQKWAADMDRMIRLDGRTEEEVKAVIEFSQKDNFWKANILSAAKLREKYDTLFLQMKERANRKQPGKTTYIPQANNYEQREYAEDYLDSLYANTPKRKTE